MGMSASQARLLALTAQLSDVEFEGQQINTARTHLSNQSAKFYNQLYDMEVPTPPLKTDYTNLTYTFDYMGAQRTISNIGAVDKDGNAKITTQYTGYGATVKANGEAVQITATEKKIASEKTGYKTTNKDDLYTDETTSYKRVKQATEYNPEAEYVDAAGNKVDVTSMINEYIAAGDNFIDAEGNIVKTYTTPMYDNSGEQTTEPDIDPETGEQKIGEDGEPLVKFTGKYKPESDTPVSAAQILNDALLQKGITEIYEVAPETTTEGTEGTEGAEGAEGAEPDETTYYYIGTKAGSTTEYTINGQAPQTLDSLPGDSTARQELEKAIKQTGKNPEDYYIIPDTSNELGYALVAKTDVKDGNDNAAKLAVSHTSSALYEETQDVNIKFATNGRISSITLADGTEIAVEPKTTLDEFGYEEAYAQYTYEKRMYDQAQAEINKQLSTIQQQDKRLELQLKELDTRRTQLTTEMDALNSVLKESTERGYKTFSG